jgi:lysophospholipase L1-like esterase
MDRRAALAFLVSTVGACGGGGSPEATGAAIAPPNPSPNPAPTPAPTPASTAPAPTPTPAPAVRRNVWQYTEDVGSNRYSAQNSAKQTNTMVVSGITLTQWTSSNFSGSLRSPVNGLGVSPFTPGKRYLVSAHLFNPGAEQFVWMRPLANGGSPGHGAKLLQPNTTNRIWMLAQATSVDKLDFMPDGTVALGNGSGIDPHWVFTGSTEGGAVDAYLGGFMIEEAPAGYTDGIAMIGDSTMEGASGATDSSSTNAREVSVWMGARMNVPVFNRANWGERTDTMDARWAVDITPLAANCKYVVIQGGINDITQGRALASIQTSIASMISKAQTDGLIPVMFTCTPFGTTPAKEADRLALNAWMKTIFPSVIDIASVVEDPTNPANLRPDAGWYGDGVHYASSAKRAVGIFAAEWSGWELAAPTVYQAILADTFSG